jgi:hypothetical protein
MSKRVLSGLPVDVQMMQSRALEPTIGQIHKFSVPKTSLVISGERQANAIGLIRNVHSPIMIQGTTGGHQEHMIARN